MKTIKGSISLLVLSFILLNCGSGKDLPSKEDIEGLVDNPGVQKPSPTPGPTASPTPTPTPPPQLVCEPRPPSIGRMQPVIHNRPRPGKIILDVTPKVCDKDYCYAVGFGGRECCPTRFEGDPVRAVCDELVLGYNSSGVVGPTWSITGPGRIEVHPDNPYLAMVFGNGTAKACANVSPFTCGTIDITDNNP